MALCAGGLIQDQNLNIRYTDASAGLKTNVSKAPRKGVLGGRTPLGDLSNSLKPSLSQTSKKQNSNIFSLTEKETCGISGATKKKSTSKASAKVQTGGRKALSDISNSGKPHLKESDGSNHLDAIAEEGFLHNHQNCIEAQTRVMDVDQFLKTIGLDNDFPEKAKGKVKVKAQSPLRHFEVEEMTELLIDDQSWKQKLPCYLDSPTPCRTPISPKLYMQWKDIDYDHINFKLIDTPDLPKH